MKKVLVRTPAIILFAIGLSPSLFAPDDKPSPKQLRAIALELLQKSKALAEQGKPDAAEATKRKALEILKKLEPQRDRDRPRADRERDKPREGERDRPRRDRDREEDRDRDRKGDERERDNALNRELENWIQKQEERIRDLREAGKNKEALKVIAEVRRVIAQHRAKHGEDQDHGDGHERAQANELETWVSQQRRKIAELREAGKREQAQALAQEVEKVIARHRDRREHGEREHGEGKRIEHIAAAIEHLRAAGLNEFAAQLEREVHGRRENRDHPEGHAHEHRPEGIDQLRRDVNELRDMLRELQKHLRDKRERD